MFELLRQHCLGCQTVNFNEHNFLDKILFKILLTSKINFRQETKKKTVILLKI